VSLLRHLSPLQARLLLVLFACAMLARALVPTGWMPVATAQGLWIVPCSGTGPMIPQAAAPMAHAMPGMHHEDPDHGTTGVDHPCAFAGVTPALDAPTLAIALPPPFVRAVPSPIRALVAVGRGLAAPPPPQTGPPTFA
jgi:hypothetical protein